MSHITDIDVRVREAELDCFERACEKVNLEFRRNQVGHAWWGNYVGDSRDYGELDPKEMGKTNVHAVRIPGTTPKNGPQGPWEIGLYRAKDGDGYKLYFDQFGGAGRQLIQHVGENANKLRQAYATEVALKNARAKLSPKGYRVSVEQLANGRMLVRARR